MPGAPVTAPALLTAQRIDPKYELLRTFREADTRATYLVRHRLLDELRVIKVVRCPLESDPERRQRFQREARIAIQLHHPNVARHYDFSIDEAGTASLVLEYVDGLTLGELGGQPEAHDLALGLAIARPALAALDFLHRKGIVLGGLTPDSFMVTLDREGEILVRLVDLGTLGILEGGVRDMPRYAPPEQLTSGELDSRADLYSFSLVLCELVTGCCPVRRRDAAATADSRGHSEPIPFDEIDPGGSVPPELRQLLATALASDPRARPASAEVLANALAAIAARLPGRPRGEIARRIASARAGAASRREHALTEAARTVLAGLERGDFAGARDRLSAATAELGNDPELADLGHRIEVRERERRVAAAEAESFERLLAEAGAALAAGDLAAAHSQVTEALVRRPDDERVQGLSAAIDERRRRQDAEAARSQAVESAAAAPTPVAPRGATVSLPGTPTAEIPVAVEEVPPAPVRLEYAAFAAAAAPARRRGALPSRIALLALAAAVGAGGWLLWRGGTGNPGDGADAAPAGYREGLAALAAGDAATAAACLRTALAEDGRERPGYLPWFHLGQALVDTGQCAEGLMALAASEQQGALAAAPEAALLPALRARCPAPPDP